MSLFPFVCYLIRSEYDFSLTKGCGPLFILIHWIPKMLNLSLVQNVTLQMLNWLKSRYVSCSSSKVPYSSITFSENMERWNKPSYQKKVLYLAN